MKQNYKYQFKDGYVCFVSYKMTKDEIKREEKTHGKCICIVRV